VAYHYEDNSASGGVLEKAGMTRVRVLRDGAAKSNGETIGIVIYAVSAFLELPYT
jgi:RimJ/RimL family protein N-acetyltransferase